MKKEKKKKEKKNHYHSLFNTAAYKDPYREVGEGSAGKESQNPHSYHNPLGSAWRADYLGLHSMAYHQVSDKTHTLVILNYVIKGMSCAVKPVLKTTSLKRPLI